MYRGCGWGRLDLQTAAWSDLLSPVAGSQNPPGPPCLEFPPRVARSGPGTAASAGLVEGPLAGIGSGSGGCRGPLCNDPDRPREPADEFASSVHAPGEFPGTPLHVWSRCGASLPPRSLAVPQPLLGLPRRRLVSSPPLLVVLRPWLAFSGRLIPLSAHGCFCLVINRFGNHLQRAILLEQRRREIISSCES